MAFDAETAAPEFTEPVTELFDRAHVEGPIPLLFLFGYELCSLGGSEQAL